MIIDDSLDNTDFPVPSADQLGLTPEGHTLLLGAVADVIALSERQRPDAVRPIQVRLYTIRARWVVQTLYEAGYAPRPLAGIAR